MGHVSVDWSQAPDEARWWAIDGEGYAYWFCMPVAADFSQSWVQENFEAPEFGYTGDWRQSLTQRP